MTRYVRQILNAKPERLGLFRVALGAFLILYLLGRLPEELSAGTATSARFEPVGLVALLGLEAPLPHALSLLIYAATLAAAAAFFWGVHFQISGPLCALFVLWITSYKSSFGMLFHSENLVTLHTLLVGFSPAAQTVSWDARRGRSATWRAVPSGWPLLACALVAVVAYLLAGIAKLKLSGFDFVSGEVLRAQIAYDNVRKLEFGTMYAPLGVWSVKHPALFPVLGVLTLLAELGGGLALLGRRWALGWVLLIVGFHWGVVALMAITFVYPLSGVPFFCFFPLEETRWGRWVVARLSKR